MGRWLALIALCLFCIELGFVLGYDLGVKFMEKEGEKDAEVKKNDY